MIYGRSECRQRGSKTLSPGLPVRRDCTCMNNEAITDEGNDERVSFALVYEIVKQSNPKKRHFGEILNSREGNLQLKSGNVGGMDTGGREEILSHDIFTKIMNEPSEERTEKATNRTQINMETNI
jgi:hypothetical protein